MRGRKRQRKKARTLYVGRPRRRAREFEENDAYIVELERLAAIHAINSRLEDVFRRDRRNSETRETLIAALTAQKYEIVAFSEPGVVTLRLPRTPEMVVIEGRIAT